MAHTEMGCWLAHAEMGCWLAHTEMGCWLVEMVLVGRDCVGHTGLIVFCCTLVLPISVTPSDSGKPESKSTRTYGSLLPNMSAFARLVALFSWRRGGSRTRRC